MPDQTEGTTGSQSQDKSQSLNITIDLGNIESMGTSIVEEAARQLLGTYYTTDDGGRAERPNALSRSLTKKVDDAVAGYVKDIAEAYCREILATGVPSSGSYGQPLRDGSTTTIAELIRERLSKELTQRSSIRSGSDGRSVLDNVMREQVERVLQRELGDEVKAAKAKVRDAIATEASKIFTDAIAKQVGI